MDYTKETTDSTVNVHMNGQFTFSDHTSFREILSSLAGKKVDMLVLDLSKVEFVDSAALGMFLLAREDAEKNNYRLALKSPRGQVEKMFQVSKFNALFDII